MRCTNEECGDNTIVSEIGDDGKVSRHCHKCGAKWMPYAAAPAPAVAIEEQAVKPKGKPATVTATTRHTSAAPKFNVLQAARARLRELDREIARLEKLKRERDQLARLLDAAKTTNGAKAIPLRRCAT